MILSGPYRINALPPPRPHMLSSLPLAPAASESRMCTRKPCCSLETGGPALELELPQDLPGIKLGLVAAPTLDIEIEAMADQILETTYSASRHDGALVGPYGLRTKGESGMVGGMTGDPFGPGYDPFGDPESDVSRIWGVAGGQGLDLLSGPPMVWNEAGS